MSYNNYEYYVPHLWHVTVLPQGLQSHMSHDPNTNKTL